MSDTTKITTLIVKNHPYNIYNYKNPLFYHHHWHPGDFLTRFQHTPTSPIWLHPDLCRFKVAELMRLDSCLQQTARTSFQGHWLSLRAERRGKPNSCCVMKKPQVLTGRLLWDGGFWPSFSWGDFFEEGLCLEIQKCSVILFQTNGMTLTFAHFTSYFFGNPKMYRSINNNSAQLAHIFWKAVCLSYQNSALGELGDLHVRSCWWWGEAREFSFDAFVLKAHRWNTT